MTTLLPSWQPNIEPADRLSRNATASAGITSYSEIEKRGHFAATPKSPMGMVPGTCGV